MVDKLFGLGGRKAGITGSDGLSKGSIAASITSENIFELLTRVPDDLSVGINQKSIDTAGGEQIDEAMHRSGAVGTPFGLP